MNSAATADTVGAEGNTRLSLLLVMAMFVLVVDTSLMTAHAAMRIRGRRPFVLASGRAG